jgi:hypothetical protein
MATLYPSSGYAESLDLVETARAWAGDLAQIPAEAVLECYRRTMNGWVGTFPPSIGDFRKTWLDPEWDYWAQLNRDPETEALAALPPGPTPNEGPGLQTCREQFNHLRATGTFVCCLCHDEHRNYPTAIRSGDGHWWVCASGRCDFREPFVEVEVETVAADEVPAPESGGQRLAEEANLDWASCTPAQQSQLDEMSRWLEAGERSVSPESFLPLWNEFQSGGSRRSTL